MFQKPLNKPARASHFYYEGWRVVEEHDGSDAIQRQYVYGNYLDEVWTIDNRSGGNTVASLNDGTGNQRHFYHCNTLYHVYGITDETGALIEAYQYDAYGKQTVINDGNDGDTVVNFNGNDVRTVGGNSTVGNPYMYGGYRYDPETGNHYCINRYFSTDLGRWLSRDPIGYFLGNSLNLYQYVGSRSLYWTDARGLGEGEAPPPPPQDEEALRKRLAELQKKIAEINLARGFIEARTDKTNCLGWAMNMGVILPTKDKEGKTYGSLKSFIEANGYSCTDWTGKDPNDCWKHCGETACEKGNCNIYVVVYRHTQPEGKSPLVDPWVPELKTNDYHGYRVVGAGKYESVSGENPSPPKEINTMEPPKEWKDKPSLCCCNDRIKPKPAPAPAPGK